MRAYPFQIIVVTALSVLAPAAYGSARPPHAPKAAAHAAATPAKVAATARKQGKAVPAAKAERADKHARGAKHVEPAKAEKPGKGHKGRQVEEPAPVQTRLVHGRRVVPAPTPAPRLVAKAERPAPIAPALVPAAEPEAAPALEPIHVTHDRKQHFAPGPAGDADQGPDTARKATSADFLSVDTPPLDLPAAVAPKIIAARAVAARSPIPVKPATIVRTSPTAGVVVGAKVDLKPAPLPVDQIAPEPLVSLYDKRGRLVVPPAMKGSHEVLVHQNVMADSDGLERVQDDEDLSRMRASHMLVALPDNDGLQTDERLPENRRYCRPWTAAFLTALARAHYARFHTALQVNSAVRTVEFQQRLIRTNGNAAPAEGETASPHLTGQAVDLAKHGLSMTEIAWLRGYLLPLVQEGKVDVEEEFQQACFHISVYRKYLPQPAVRRNIAEGKRTPGTTLAAALP